MTKLDEICEKIKPYLSEEFQTGQLSAVEFKKLIKTITDLTPQERKYINSNFRLIITKLSLYHYLPEIQGKEDIVLLQMAEVLISRWLLNQEDNIRTRRQAIDKLQKWLISSLKEYEGKTKTVSDITDIQHRLQNLRVSVAHYWKEDPSKIPVLIDQFRDDIVTISSSVVTYDINKTAREVKSKKINDLEELMDKIDEWDKKLAS